ncbi:hypothetical protein KR059_004950 [Drosophila kikkawai]|nr:hypothetical protein KR059_004950 [Drosophila kikkawai]
MALNCGCSPPMPSANADNKDVFCSGPLLDRVQQSCMFPDSKYFVDMSCIYTTGQTLSDYQLFSNCARNDGSLEFLQMFVEKHFNPPGSELEHWVPTDWKPLPSFLNKVCDPALKQFAAEINELWKQLGRRIKDDVKMSPDLYSIIYVPNPFIVPDTNSREYSYWGSFWIIRGLLQCGMHQTARGMIENFLALVQEFGYVPACGRIYCTGRTQPPLLIMMMKSYVDVTKDEQFAIKSLPLLEKEYESFTSQRSIDVKGRTMYQYRAVSCCPGPRPEAYREDLAAANKMDDAAREKYYTELKSASESGQDFSSRWFVAKGGSSEASLQDTKPSAIVPVELNAIIFRSGKILAEFNRKAGNAKKAEEYQDRCCVLVKAIRDVLWSNQAGIWLDYDVENNRPRNYFCCTNFAPLWARAFPLIDTDKVSKAIMEHIKTNNLDNLYGGVPHTLNKTAGQKWDYPNVFPPMMFMVLEGLDNLGTRASKAMSRRWAHRWVKSNYEAFRSEGFMSEKYFCEEFGTTGEACPNQAAVGYGWTNAVIIEFLCKYGREITMSDEEDKACKCTADRTKASFVITSRASMEKAFPPNTSTKSIDKRSCLCDQILSKTTTIAGSAFRPATSSKCMDKKKSCNCVQMVDRSTAAMGTQSAANCYSQEQQQSNGCCCAMSKTQMVPVQDRGKSGNDGGCACGVPQQNACSSPQQNSCSCDISRTQMVPVQDKNQSGKQGNCSPGSGGTRTPSSARSKKQEASGGCNTSSGQQKQHDPDCPCSQNQNTRSQSPSKSGSQSPSKAKQQKQQASQQCCSCPSEKQQQDPDCTSEAQENACEQEPGEGDQDCPAKRECAEEEEQRRQEEQAKLVGHYSPLADDMPDECPKPPKKKKCCYCCDKDKDKHEETDEDATSETKSADHNSATDSCHSIATPRTQGNCSPQQNKAPNCCYCTAGTGAQASGAQSKGSKSPQQNRAADGCRCGEGAGAQGKGAQGKGAQNKGAKAKSGDCSPQQNKAADSCQCTGGSGAQSPGSQSKGAKSKSGDCSPQQNKAADSCQCTGGSGAQSPGAQSKGANSKSGNCSPQQNTAANSCCCTGGSGAQSSGAQGKEAKSKSQQSRAPESCSCFGGPGIQAADDCWCQAQTSIEECREAQGKQAQNKVAPSKCAICPHCGGVYTCSTENVHSSEATKANSECCKDTQMRGMSNIGLQKSCHRAEAAETKETCKEYSQKDNTECDQQAEEDCCDCCEESGGPDQGCEQNAGSSGGAAGCGGQSEPGDCDTRMAEDFPPEYGPTPIYNKQFSLKDPGADDDGCPKKEVKKPECCCCKEKENEEEE